MTSRWPQLTKFALALCIPVLWRRMRLADSHDHALTLIPRELTLLERPGHQEPRRPIRFATVRTLRLPTPFTVLLIAVAMLAAACGSQTSTELVGDTASGAEPTGAAEPTAVPAPTTATDPTTPPEPTAVPAATPAPPDASPTVVIDGEVITDPEEAAALEEALNNGEIFGEDNDNGDNSDLTHRAAARTRL